MCVLTFFILHLSTASRTSRHPSSTASQALHYIVSPRVRTRGHQLGLRKCDSPGYIYIRYSSCRYNERQLIDVTVVRLVRPRAERWCDCEGHRRWKRAGSTLFAIDLVIGYPRRR